MSKFSGLIKAVQEEKKKPVEEPRAGAQEEVVVEKPEKKKTVAKPKTASRLKPATAKSFPAAAKSSIAAAKHRAAELVMEKPATKTRKIGRSADPDYSKSTMYIHQDVHQDVKRALIGSGRDYSELVEDLLREWLTKNG